MRLWMKNLFSHMYSCTYVCACWSCLGILIMIKKVSDWPLDRVLLDTRMMWDFQTWRMGNGVSEHVLQACILISQLQTLQAKKSWTGSRIEARVQACMIFRACRTRAATFGVEHWVYSTSLYLSTTLELTVHLQALWPCPTNAHSTRHNRILYIC